MLSVELRTCCLCLNVLMQIDIKTVPSGPIDNKPVQWNLYKATTNFMVFQERWFHDRENKPGLGWNMYLYLYLNTCTQIFVFVFENPQDEIHVFVFDRHIWVYLTNIFQIYFSYYL